MRSHQRGEIALTLTLIGLLSMAIGAWFGARLQTRQQTASRAQSADTIVVQPNPTQGPQRGQTMLNFAALIRVAQTGRTAIQVQSNDGVLSAQNNYYAWGPQDVNAYGYLPVTFTAYLNDRWTNCTSPNYFATFRFILNSIVNYSFAPVASTEVTVQNPNCNAPSTITPSLAPTTSSPTTAPTVAPSLAPTLGPEPYIRSAGIVPGSIIIAGNDVGADVGIDFCRGRYTTSTADYSLRGNYRSYSDQRQYDFSSSTGDCRSERLGLVLLPSFVSQNRCQAISLDAVVQLNTPGQSINTQYTRSIELATQTFPACSATGGGGTTPVPSLAPSIPPSIPAPSPTVCAYHNVVQLYDSSNNPYSSTNPVPAGFSLTSYKKEAGGNWTPAPVWAGNFGSNGQLRWDVDDLRAINYPPGTQVKAVLAPNQQILDTVNPAPPICQNCFFQGTQGSRAQEFVATTHCMANNQSYTYGWKVSAPAPTTSPPSSLVPASGLGLYGNPGSNPWCGSQYGNYGADPAQRRQWCHDGRAKGTFRFSCDVSKTNQRYMLMARRVSDNNLRIDQSNIECRAGGWAVADWVETAGDWRWFVRTSDPTNYDANNTSTFVDSATFETSSNGCNCTPAGGPAPTSATPTTPPAAGLPAGRGELCTTTSVNIRNPDPNSNCGVIDSISAGTRVNSTVGPYDYLHCRPPNVSGDDRGDRDRVAQGLIWSTFLGTCPTTQPPAPPSTIQCEREGGYCELPFVPCGSNYTSSGQLGCPNTYPVCCKSTSTTPTPVLNLCLFKPGCIEVANACSVGSTCVGENYCCRPGEVTPTPSTPPPAATATPSSPPLAAGTGRITGRITITNNSGTTISEVLAARCEKGGGNQHCAYSLWSLSQADNSTWLVSGSTLTYDYRFTRDGLNNTLEIEQQYRIVPPQIFFSDGTKINSVHLVLLEPVITIPSSGTVTQNFTITIPSIPSTPPPSSGPRFAVDSLDLDNDGSVNRSDLEIAIANYNQEVTVKEQKIYVNALVLSEIINSVHNIQSP